MHVSLNLEDVVLPLALVVLLLSVLQIFILMMQLVQKTNLQSPVVDGLNAWLADSAGGHVELTDNADWQRVESQDFNALILRQASLDFDLLAIIAQFQVNWSVNLDGADRFNSTDDNRGPNSCFVHVRGDSGSAQFQFSIQSTTSVQALGLKVDLQLSIDGAYSSIQTSDGQWQTRAGWDLGALLTKKLMELFEFMKLAYPKIMPKC